MKIIPKSIVIRDLTLSVLEIATLDYLTEYFLIFTLDIGIIFKQDFPVSICD